MHATSGKTYKYVRLSYYTIQSCRTSETHITRTNFERSEIYRDTQTQTRRRTERQTEADSRHEEFLCIVNELFADHDD